LEIQRFFCPTQVIIRLGFSHLQLTCYAALFSESVIPAHLSCVEPRDIVAESVRGSNHHHSRVLRITLHTKIKSRFILSSASSRGSVVSGALSRPSRSDVLCERR